MIRMLAKNVKKTEIWREIPTYRHIPATRQGFIIFNHGEHGPNEREQVQTDDAVAETN